MRSLNTAEKATTQQRDLTKRAQQREVMNTILIQINKKADVNTMAFKLWCTI